MFVNKLKDKADFIDSVTGRGQLVTRRLSAAVGALVLALAMALPLMAAAPAAAASGCSAYVTSNGRPGGGVSGFCEFGPGSYRVVGLCINEFFGDSWWVYGNWTSSGMSYVTCPWYAHPGQYPFMQTR